MWKSTLERRSLYTVACLCLYLAGAVHLSSNQALPDAPVTGTVRDINAEEVPDIVVVLHNLKTGAEQDTKTDRFEEYVFSRVRPGIYTLEAGKSPHLRTGSNPSICRPAGKWCLTYWLSTPFHNTEYRSPLKAKCRPEAPSSFCSSGALGCALELTGTRVRLPPWKAGAANSACHG